MCFQSRVTSVIVVFSVKGYVRKGVLLKAMQQYDKAMEAFQKAIEIDENYGVSAGD